MVQVLPQKRLTTHACHFPRTLKSNMLSCGASSMLPSMMRCSPSAAPRNLEFGICECSQLFGTVET
uniref:Uncharacterized protein n=2 Tax=Aegilops tauschii subsp. strangulata TaxID=200361 RepID=A0A453R582_AEGTS